MILDSDSSHPLSDQGKVASWISGVTGEAEASVRSRLLAEYEEPGSTVRQALGEAGLEPFVWSYALIRFYEQTDAFLYELVIWKVGDEAPARALEVSKDLTVRVEAADLHLSDRSSWEDD